MRAAILVQHFSFGWQALDVLNLRCRLQSHALGARVEAQLMRGMPRPQAEAACGPGELKDGGPPAEIEAVRQKMRGPLVPYVIVAGDWALGERYGAGGGETLYRRRSGSWNVVAGGGGAMRVAEIRAYGVPQSDWCKFGIYDAKCR